MYIVCSSVLFGFRWNCLAIGTCLNMHVHVLICMWPSSVELFMFLCPAPVMTLLTLFSKDAHVLCLFSRCNLFWHVINTYSMGFYMYLKVYIYYIYGFVFYMIDGILKLYSLFSIKQVFYRLSIGIFSACMLLNLTR